MTTANNGADLDGKLRELAERNGLGSEFSLGIIREAAALGRAEGLRAIEAWTENEIKLHEENAVKCDSSRNHYGWLWDTNAAVALKNAAEAIRTLKENVSNQ